MINNSSSNLVTFMYDFYGLPNDFYNLIDDTDQYNNKSVYEKIAFLENKIVDDINDSKLIPYFQVHEFEALLFSDLSIIFDHFDQEIPNLEKNRLSSISLSPELINQNNPPSKRLISSIPTYRKVTDGILISQKIGVETIREKCPNFNSWLEKIEKKCLD